MRQDMPVHYSAADYDRYTARYVQEYDEGLIGRLIQEYRLLGGGPRTVIDIGTGTAQLLVRIAVHPQLGELTLIGTDLFEDMVARAEETVRAAGLNGRVTIERCNVHDLPYSDNFADLVISRSTIHHWADPVRAFREIYRVLKPKGVSVIHEPRRDPNPNALAVFNGQRREAGIEPVRLDEKYTAAEVRGFLREAGLLRRTLVTAPRRGPGSMGFEVRICKAHPVHTMIVSAVAKCSAVWIRNPWSGRTR